MFYTELKLWFRQICRANVETRQWQKMKIPGLGLISLQQYTKRDKFTFNNDFKILRNLYINKSMARFSLLGYFMIKCHSECVSIEDGVAQSVEHWTANLATRVRSPVGEEPSDLICAFLHVQMESNWSVCNCRHIGKWCGTIKAVGNTDHTRQTWIHMQTPLSPLAGCGPVRGWRDEWQGP